jgi:hypothetical protein
MSKLFARIVLGPEYRIIRFKSWKLWLGPYGIEWPVILVDRCGMRSTIVPVWDRYQFRAVVYRLVGKEPPDLNYPDNFSNTM